MIELKCDIRNAEIIEIFQDNQEQLCLRGVPKIIDFITQQLFDLKRLFGINAGQIIFGDDRIGNFHHLVAIVLLRTPNLSYKRCIQIVCTTS
jgi:hypothetical protein